ncbi:hypothetical protein [Lacticaseibacillus parakribbianus]|uniref:hypothetical protein n=1 Tax=Lacticaseibacillus parakribbianus TaxID=2970927 RepID=UPI0021CB859D|nr:hypothetical protein [Lacticaseibacillus parakribbianus]
MRVKVIYATNRWATSVNVLWLTLMWTAIAGLLALNVLFDIGYFNDFVAPLYNLFNIEWQLGATIVKSLGWIITIISGLALMRVLWTHGKEN